MPAGDASFTTAQVNQKTPLTVITVSTATEARVHHAARRRCGVQRAHRATPFSVGFFDPGASAHGPFERRKHRWAATADLARASGMPQQNALQMWSDYVLSVVEGIERKVVTLHVAG
jgi:hypothetical protein